MATAREFAAEKDVLNEISPAALMEYTETIAQWSRESGSPGERQAMAYIAETLESFGLDVERHSFEGFLSLPLRAELEILSPTRRHIRCITQAFAAPTPASGLEGEVVYLDPTDLRSGDVGAVRGKIGLIDGLAMPSMAKLAEELGLAAQIFVNDDHLHNMIVSPVWGTPTPDSARQLPKTPSISIRQDDGQFLKRLVLDQTVRVLLKAEVSTGWTKVPLVTGHIPGMVEPDRYVLFSGHVDSWHFGAMDNASANATALEVARVLARFRGHLRRGVRFAFWPGHSQGRYAGSTWYADQFWLDLYENCVAHVNVDCTGAMGATSYLTVPAMAETKDFAEGVVRKITGQNAAATRVSRSADQSFWGVGIPSVLTLLSLVPPESEVACMSGMDDIIAEMGGGTPWWWHTEADTVDKIDADVLHLDTQVYAATILGLCTTPVLPFDYVRVADEFLAVLEDLQDRCKGRFDLEPVVQEAAQLRSGACELQEFLGQSPKQTKAPDEAERNISRINACLIKLGRLLIPLNYTVVGSFDHDPALPVPPLPSLQPAAELATLDPQSDAFLFLKNQLTRRRNMVVHGLRQARREIEATMGLLAQTNHPDVLEARDRMTAAARAAASAGRIRDLAALQAIDGAAAQSLGLDELLRNSLDKILEVLDADNGAILLLEPDGETMTLRVLRGLPEEVVEAIHNTDLSGGMSSLSRVQQKPVVLDVAEYPNRQRQALFVKEGIQTFASTRLLSAGNLVGALNVGTRRPRPEAFSPQDLELLAAIGEHLGGIIEKAQRMEQREQKRE